MGYKSTGTNILGVKWPENKTANIQNCGVIKGIH